MSWIKILLGNKKSIPETRRVYVDTAIDTTKVAQSSHPAFAFKELIKESIKDYQVSPANNTKSYITDKAGYRGVAISPISNVDIHSIQAYAKSIKERCQEVGYICKMSEYRKKEQIEYYKYYLKPSVKLQSGLKADQLFGNISIELQSNGNKPKQFSIVSTYYQDANFMPVRSIDEWFDVIFFESDFNL